MNPMAVAQRMTAQEYLAVAYDGVRSQLVAGEVIVQQPNLPHQQVLRALDHALEAWIRAESRRGQVTWPIDVLIDEHNVFGPDLLWYADGHSPDRDAERPYPMPDLAVEARSPSTWRYDIGAKKTVYGARACPSCGSSTATPACCSFSAAPRRRPPPSTSRWSSRAATLSSPLLPGFALDVGALFDLGGHGGTSANSGGPRRRERCVGEFGIRRGSAGIVQRRQ